MGKPVRKPDEADLQWMEDTDRRLSRLERRRPTSIRFEAADGAYAILGVQDDGSVGLKTFDHTGAPVGNYTAT